MLPSNSELFSYIDLGEADSVYREPHKLTVRKPLTLYSDKYIEITMLENMDEDTNIPTYVEVSLSLNNILIERFRVDYVEDDVLMWKKLLIKVHNTWGAFVKRLQELKDRTFYHADKY